MKNSESSSSNTFFKSLANSAGTAFFISETYSLVTNSWSLQQLLFNKNGSPQQQMISVRYMISGVSSNFSYL